MVDDKFRYNHAHGWCAKCLRRTQAVVTLFDSEGFVPCPECGEHLFDVSIHDPHGPIYNTNQLATFVRPGKRL